MVQFLLNDNKIYDLEKFDPNTTVLNYLRDKGLVGTKEGCASGDCGACTVVVVSLKEKKLQYKSINSCICLLSDLAGKQLITVEALQREKQLHPVQRAMVEKHGSQCGYCTPGFVMSLFALYKNNTQKIKKEQVLEALGGNLCRCTGYRPIIDAALSLKIQKDVFQKSSKRTIEILSKIENKKFTFHPKTITDLSNCIEKHPQAKLICGGSDLLLDITQKHQNFPGFIHLKKVQQMHSITENKKSIFIGAAVLLSEIKNSIEKIFPSFHDLLQRFASLQIRNQASLGGNLANAAAIADTPPILMTLEASAILRKGKNIRKVAIKDFFTGYRKTVLKPKEFIESIEIPKTKKLLLQAYKISKRWEDDISALCGAFSLVLDKKKIVQKIIIAYCGLSAYPKIATETQNFLQGKKWDKQTIQQAQILLEKDYQPITDFRASKEYRMQVCKNLLLKFYQENL